MVAVVLPVISLDEMAFVFGKEAYTINPIELRGVKMKKVIAICFILLINFTTFNVFGEIHRDIYARSFHIYKIYVHPLGYLITFTKPTGMGLSFFYIPYSWFTKAGGNGEMVWGNNRAYPYFSIIWINGKFDHIKIYVHENLDHFSWDKLNKNTDEVKDKFDITPEHLI